MARMGHRNLVLLVLWSMPSAIDCILEVTTTVGSEGGCSFRGMPPSGKRKMKIELKNVTEIAYFRSQGFEIQDVRVSVEGQRSTVYFALEMAMSEDQFKSLRSDFLNRRAFVEPRLYTELVRNTTDLLFETLRKEKRK